MRHVLAFFAFAALLAAAAGLLDSIAARGPGPVVAWVVMRDPAALRAVMAGGDLRVLDLRAGGHLAQLYLPSGRDAVAQPEGAWTLRLAPGLAWPGCG